MFHPEIPDAYEENARLMKKILFALLVLVAALSAFSCKKTNLDGMTSLSIEPGSLELPVGEEKQLAVFSTPPELLDGETVHYISNQPDVIEVSPLGGRVKALRVGTATITATCGELEAQCVVTSFIPVLKLEFDTPKLIMRALEEKEVQVTVSPADATRSKVDFTISNTTVVNLDNKVQNGATTRVTVIAVGTGQSVITAKCDGKAAYLYVSVGDPAVPVTGLTVQPASFTLKAGESGQFSATVTPSHATDKTVTWVSANPSVATVDAEGKVTAERPGETKVWAYCGNQSQALPVKVTPPDGAVDLGLSVCWAQSNLEASAFHQPGGFYAWGELSPKTVFSWSNYRFRQSGDSWENVKFTRYNTLKERGTADQKLNFSDYDYEDDAARRKLGGKWRVPSPADFEELVENCTAVWEVIPGLGSGVRFTSNVPGYKTQSIFLPAAGYMGDSFTDAGKKGAYWSSYVRADNPVYARSMDFVYTESRKELKIFEYAGINSRCMGLSIRPVW